jgi:hypothetical protein
MAPIHVAVVVSGLSIAGGTVGLGRRQRGAILLLRRCGAELSEALEWPACRGVRQDSEKV